MDVQQALEKLALHINEVPIRLKALSETELSEKPAANKWSKKQIVGHLIDSATNNHQRFVRAQFEHEPAIRYAQDDWVNSTGYQEMDRGQIISFWENYNKFLIELIKRIPAEKLHNKVRVGESLHTLEFLILDYVVHMEHHVRQL